MLDKLLNLGNFTDKSHKNKGNNDNVNNPYTVANEVIFPIIGKFTRTTGVFLPSYISGGLAPTPTPMLRN